MRPSGLGQGRPRTANFDFRILNYTNWMRQIHESAKLNTNET